MKQHKDMTPELILEKMRMPPDGTLLKDGAPVNPQEDAEAKEALIRIAADPSKVHVHCIGCGGRCEILQSKCCACGGFVCPACLRVETEGVCDHQEPLIPNGAMEFDEDENGTGGTFAIDDPPPTPETLTVRQALQLLEQAVDNCTFEQLHGKSRVNPNMEKYQALDILLRALEDRIDLDAVVASSGRNKLLAQNILKECGFL